MKVDNTQHTIYDKLEKVFSHLLDNHFLSELKQLRSNGRNDYSLELLWKSLLAYHTYRSSSLTELSNKLKATPYFPNFPSASSFSRFQILLKKAKPSLDHLQAKLLEKLAIKRKIPLAIALFGDIHLLWEPTTAMPIFFESILPNESQSESALKILSKLKFMAPSFFRKTQYLIADQHYEELIESVFETYNLKPIIPLKNLDPQKSFYRFARYDETGRVYCANETKPTAMVFAGFEKQRNSLKYRCISKHYQFECKKQKDCPHWKGLRIPLRVNKKIFTPIPRTSYRWASLYQLYETKNAIQTIFFSSSKRNRSLELQIQALITLSLQLND